MVDKQITKLTDSLVTAVDSIDKAKQYIIIMMVNY